MGHHWPSHDPKSAQNGFVAWRQAAPKGRLAKVGWNGPDPQQLSLAHSSDSCGRWPLGRRPDDHAGLRALGV